jgi:hypothetical protein
MLLPLVCLHYVPLTLARSRNLLACSPCRGRDSAFGIMTYCRMDVRGSNPGGGKVFRFSTPAKSSDGADPKIDTEDFVREKETRARHLPPTPI